MERRYSQGGGSLGRAVAAALVMGLLLGACATTVTPPTLPANTLWRLHHARVQAIDQWAFSGRVAVQAAEDSWNARVRWSQRGELFEIAFLTPFGGQVAELRGSENKVVLTRPDEPPTEAADAAAVLESALGWPAPVNGLRYWLRGLPRPDAGGAPVLDRRGRMIGAAQDDWEIRIERYDEVDGTMLPEKLTLSRSQLRIRLVIDEWRIISFK